MSSAFIVAVVLLSEKGGVLLFCWGSHFTLWFALYHSARGIRASGTAMGTGAGGDGHSKELAG